MPCLSTSVIVRSWMLRFAFRSASRHAVSGRAILEVSDAGQLELDDLHRHLAGDFARRVTAHAVGDDEQSAVARRRSVHREVVLVP